jgi:hypothetical protein
MRCQLRLNALKANKLPGGRQWLLKGNYHLAGDSGEIPKLMEPVVYGLKFAGAFSGASFFQSDFTEPLQAARVDATA